MQERSGITAVSFPVSEILVIGLIAAFGFTLVYWLVRRARAKKC
jgi:hypothetical protein